MADARPARAADAPRGPPTPARRSPSAASASGSCGRPGPPPGWRPEGDPNDRAVVALASVGSFDVLLPADAESEVTAGLELPRVEALKVAHHGSDDPGLPALLARTKPAFAAVEVGKGNTYGHPTAPTLAALHAAVPRVFRTDRDGTVRLRVTAGGVRIES